MNSEHNRQRGADIAAADVKSSTNIQSPDVLLYSDLYKNAMMGADSCAKMIGRTTAAEETDSIEACEALRTVITEMTEGYSGYAKTAAHALEELKVPAEQLSALEKLPAEIGITVQTLFDKSVSKCAEVMINGVTMGIIDMKKAQRICSENGCSPDACRLAEDLISFCERYVEQLKPFL